MVEGGVNVTTYAMLLRWGVDRVPAALSRSGLVFVLLLALAAGATAWAWRLLRLGYKLKS
ncbi:MAG: hypothetical protein HY906_08385 [Deltaproteobacteria bacterium]|nr:hypothetical protein [Deltaproteobacteria bacterium]